MNKVETKQAVIYYVEDTPPDKIAKKIVEEDQIGALDWGDPAHMIYVLVGKADNANPDITRRMNLIKGRPESQVLAVSGIAELTQVVGRPESSQVLRRISEQRGVDQYQIIDELFQYPVGVILEANDKAPSSVVSTKQDKRTVMVAGQSYNFSSEPYHDFYNQLVWEVVSKYGYVLAGSSLNLHGDRPFTVYEQEQLFNSMNDKLDFVLARRKIPNTTHHTKDSATVWDLTGEIPILYRSGSIAPDIFKPLLGEFISACPTPKVPTLRDRIGSFLRFLS